MTLAVDQSKALNGGVSFLGTYAFASLPAAASWTGYTAFASDLGNGNILLYSNGTRWVPLGGRAVLKTVGASGNIANSETIVMQTLIPAGFLIVGDIFLSTIQVTKSGATDSLNLGLRMGTAGTIGDTNIATTQVTLLGATGLSGSSMLSYRVASSTTVQRVGPMVSTGGAAATSTTAAPAAATVSDISNALYLSETIRSSGTTDTVALQSGFIELITG